MMSTTAKRHGRSIVCPSRWSNMRTALDIWQRANLQQSGFGPLLGFTLKHPAAEPDSISGRPWFCVIWKPLHTMQGPKFHVLDRIPAQGLRKGRHRKMSRSLAIVSASQAGRLPMTETVAQSLAVFAPSQAAARYDFYRCGTGSMRCCGGAAVLACPDRPASRAGSRPEHGNRPLFRVRPGGCRRKRSAERLVFLARIEGG